MTGKQLKAALQKIGFNQLELAHLFGLGHRTIRRYADEGIPAAARPTAILVTLLAQKKITPDDVLGAR